MKYSILYIAVVFISFNTTTKAAIQNQNVTIVTNTKEIDPKKLVANESDDFDPSTVIADQSKKSMQEIIVEKDKIIENTILNNSEFLSYELAEEIMAEYHLTNENNWLNSNSMQEFIAQKEAVIENILTDEIQPLDFKKINKKIKIKEQLVVGIK